MNAKQEISGERTEVEYHTKNISELGMDRNGSRSVPFGVPDMNDWVLAFQRQVAHLHCDGF